MNYKRYKKYIIVDAKNYRPMVFQDDQFVYAETERSRQPFALKIYTYNKARKLIKQSTEFRNKNNFIFTQYILMPIGPKLKINP